MADASAAELFLWVGLPYLALAVFVVGHIWRWRYDQFGWTSRSTQLQERRLLKWGSPVFHYATFAAIAGHVMGILVPASVTEALGISETAYRWFAAIAGAVAALLVLAGIAILAWRRLLVPRVRATTAVIDYVVLVLLLVVVVDGTVVTIADHLFGSAHEYRHSVAPWFRSLFVFQPDVAAITSATFTYQLHAVLAWPILMLWPFSRLVHAWSYPLWFLWRPYIVYRSKRAIPPPEPGTSGRRWRKIGTRF